MAEDTNKEVNLFDENVKLKKELSEMDAHVMELLEHFELALIETTNDMRILKTNGALEAVFSRVEKKLEYGKNLILLVYKATRTTHQKEEDEDTENTNGEKDLEDLSHTVDKFVVGTRPETTLKVVGEREDGEIFLMIWKIVRKDQKFVHYFKAIPSNTIVKKMQEVHTAEIARAYSNMTDILDVVSDGICMVDRKKRITYMNLAARTMYIPAGNSLLKNAKLEGRLYQDLFIMESQDEINRRLDFFDKILTTNKPVNYNKRTNERDIKFSVYPQYNEKMQVDGFIIISRPTQKQFESAYSNEEKYVKTIRTMNEHNKEMYLKLKALENENKQLKAQLSKKGPAV